MALLLLVTGTRLLGTGSVTHLLTACPVCGGIALMNTDEID